VAKPPCLPFSFKRPHLATASRPSPATSEWSAESHRIRAPCQWAKAPTWHSDVLTPPGQSCTLHPRSLPSMPTPFPRVFFSEPSFSPRLLWCLDFLLCFCLPPHSSSPPGQRLLSVTKVGFRQPRGGGGWHQRSPASASGPAKITEQCPPAEQCQNNSAAERAQKNAPLTEPPGFICKKAYNAFVAKRRVTGCPIPPKRPTSRSQ